ncbi:MAG: hypothetical protein RR495_04205 [Anaerovoracaceae bacterium]
MGAVKVKEINLERGMPTVAIAMQKLVNDLSTAKMAGYKSAVIVHGYGSSGVGGSIKVAVKSKLKEPMLRGIVRETAKGEEWEDKKREFIDVCPQLRDFNRYISGNLGVTVVLFK